jgi:hypothetical protein
MQLLKTALLYQQQFTNILITEAPGNKVAFLKNGFFPGLEKHG